MRRKNHSPKTPLRTPSRESTKVRSMEQEEEEDEDLLVPHLAHSSQKSASEGRRTVHIEY